MLPRRRLQLLVVLGVVMSVYVGLQASKQPRAGATAYASASDNSRERCCVMLCDAVLPAAVLGCCLNGCWLKNSATGRGRGTGVEPTTAQQHKSMMMRELLRWPDRPLQDMPAVEVVVGE